MVGSFRSSHTVGTYPQYGTYSSVCKTAPVIHVTRRRQRPYDCADEQVLASPRAGSRRCPVPGTSRRQQYSASTKRALVDVADGAVHRPTATPATSLDAIVAGARVTKGALYHHFSGKQALFEAVFEQVEADAAQADPAGAARAPRPVGEGAAPGCGRSSSVVQEPRYRRIVIQEGPAVLGYERYREQEERSTFGIVQDIVALGARAPATWELDEAMVQTFSRIFFGAMSSAGESVSTAEDPDQAAAAGRGRDRLHPRRAPGAGRAGRRAARPGVRRRDAEPDAGHRLSLGR